MLQASHRHLHGDQKTEGCEARQERHAHSYEPEGEYNQGLQRCHNQVDREHASVLESLHVTRRNVDQVPRCYLPKYSVHQIDSIAVAAGLVTP